MTLKSINRMHRTHSGSRTGNRAGHYEMDACSGPVLGKMLLFALPLMASSVLQLLFNAADVIVVGKFAGDNALAAVGSNGSLINLMTNLFLGLSVGVNVLVSRYYGAEDHRNVTETVHTAVAISLLSGLLLTAAGFFGAVRVLGWMKVPSEVLPLASTYLRIYFLGMTAMMVYNFGAAILRAVGDTRRPLYYLLCAGIVNVILNLFFVAVLHMGVAGVGIATVISQIISAAMILRCLVLENGDIHLDLKKIRISGSKLKRILKIGVPASIQSMLFSVSNVIIQSSINSFGAVTVAGSAAAANLEGFVYVSMNAFYQAVLTFTGQNAGAGKHERIDRIMLTGLGCVLVTGLILGQGVYRNGHVLLQLYTSSPEVMAQGIRRLTYVCVFYALCGMNEVVVGVIRGLGYSMAPMLVSVVGICGFRVIFIFTLFRQIRWHIPESLYVTYPLSWVITFAANLIVCLLIRRRMIRGHMNKNMVRLSAEH